VSDRVAHAVPKTKKRSALISDDAWAALKEASTIEDKSASELCEFLLSHYLGLEERIRYTLPAGLKTKPRSLYMPDTTWGAAKAIAVKQGRPVSAILEQLIRGYLGLELGERTPG